MSISATFMTGSNRKTLSGDGEPKRVFTPKPTPTVSHQVSTTASGGQTAPISAGRPANKRKGCFDSQIPAKRVKADEESVSVANGSTASTSSKSLSESRSSLSLKRAHKRAKLDLESVSMANVSAASTSSKPASDSTSPWTTKRPCAPQTKGPLTSDVSLSKSRSQSRRARKRAKLDLSPSAVVLTADVPPSPMPSTSVQRPIKLQLMRHN